MAEIVEELNTLEEEARETDKAQNPSSGILGFDFKKSLI